MSWFFPTKKLCVRNGLFSRFVDWWRSGRLVDWRLVGGRPVLVRNVPYDVPSDHQHEDEGDPESLDVVVVHSVCKYVKRHSILGGEYVVCRLAI
jgi:hypothetical protein